MEWALLTTALLMGLAGGAHCLAMCSPACAAAARAVAGLRPGTALLALLGGRAAAYATAGALVAASVGALGSWATAAAWLRPLWGMLHLAAFTLGAWLLWAGRVPAWLARFGAGGSSRRLDAGGTVPMWVVPVRGQRRAGAFAARGAARATLAGTLFVLLPCGLLQSALLAAALASTPASGALVMLVFALASSFSLWAGPALWLRLADQQRATRWLAGAVRLGGLTLAAASAWALVRGGVGVGAALCAAP